jgi:hypothetical protein
MNNLFDNLKDLKKDMAQSEKEANQKKEQEIKKTKEDKLKVDFESFMKASGIKKKD